MSWTQPIQPTAGDPDGMQVDMLGLHILPVEVKFMPLFRHVTSRFKGKWMFLLEVRMVSIWRRVIIWQTDQPENQCNEQRRVSFEFCDNSHIFISRKESIRLPWELNNWGRLTHLCVIKLTIFVSDNGLSPGHPQPLSEPMLDNCLPNFVGDNRPNYIDPIRQILISCSTNRLPSTINTLRPR